MDILLKCAGIAVVGIVLVIVVKKGSPDIAMLLSLVIACVILGLGFGMLENLLEFVRELTGMTGLSDDIILPVLKVTGISILTKITADICRDAGEGGIASGIETVGTIAGLYVVLPLFTSLINVMKELL